MHELLKISGYPSLQGAIHLVQDGNISNLPMLMAADIKRAYDMFGEPVGAVRGKMTQRKVSHAIYNDDLLIMDEKKLLRTEPVQYGLDWDSERQAGRFGGPPVKNQNEKCVCVCVCVCV